MKKLNLNKESLQKLDEKQMSKVRGGEAFLSLWGSNCYNTDPLRHNCCRPTTDGTPTCVPPWSANLPCDLVPYAYGDAQIAADGTLEYLDNEGNMITLAEFDPGDFPYVLI